MTAWHVDDTALARWVEGTDGSVSGASVEQHLLTCPSCRARVPAAPELEGMWAQIRDAVEVPRVSWLERALMRLHLPAADARIVAVSPALRGAWLIGLTAVLGFVAVASSSGDTRADWLFLAVAPLVPALGVALGYDPEFDEAIEQEAATPYSRLRLVLLRSVTLLVIAMPLLLVVSALVPSHLAFLWLVPAAGCTAVVLAASTWMAPLTATGAVATVWLALVSLEARGTQPSSVVADNYLAGYVAAILLSITLLVVRSSRLSQLTGGIR
jgi:hypothetical protein